MLTSIPTVQSVPRFSGDFGAPPAVGSARIRKKFYKQNADEGLVHRELSLSPELDIKLHRTARKLRIPPQELVVQLIQRELNSPMKLSMGKKTDAVKRNVLLPVALDVQLGEMARGDYTKSMPLAVQILDRALSRIPG